VYGKRKPLLAVIVMHRVVVQLLTPSLLLIDRYDGRIDSMVILESAASY
jgi:hypothetical protein